MSGDASLARLYREFGDRWEIEPVPSGTKWIAVQRESADYIRTVTAHEIGALRFRMTEVEREMPEERT
jgi:hypothetical protein